MDSQGVNVSQNIVIPNKDNRVTMVFAGVDLTQATNIVIGFGSESYNLSQPEVTVSDSETLTLDLSGTSEVGRIFPIVTYFDGFSVNGTDITSRELNNLSQIIVAIGSQLIIEDGSVVAGANSFASDAELKAFASLRGLSLPATQPERETLLIKAMDYIRLKEPLMQGERANAEQVLPYPRNDVYAYGYFVPSDSIPQSLKDAQCQAATDAQTINLLPAQNVSNIQSEKVGQLSRSYFNGGSYQGVQLKAVDAFLNPLLRNSGSLGSIRL